MLALVASTLVHLYQQWRHEAYLSSALSVAETVEVTVSAGQTLTDIARNLADQGVIRDPRRFVEAATREGKDRMIRFGKYSAEAGMTVAEMLDNLVQGRIVHEQHTIIEGTTFAQMRAALAANTLVRKTLPKDRGAAEAQLLAELGTNETQAEGLLFPDTYAFQAGTTDVEILALAYRKMRTTLAREWQKRASGLPYKTKYEALTLASIIEKEAGYNSEMAQIASVFVNRLHRSMPLQSDPTVIYALGESYDGNLQRSDLSTDSPHNTYKHKGLPPSPISMPSLAALRAALHPVESDYLYFVANDSGGHHFSRSLREHNSAVNKYQRTGSGG